MDIMWENSDRSNNEGLDPELLLVAVVYTITIKYLV